jgi:ACT domain-containing protein
MQQLASTAQEKKQLEVKERALKDALLQEIKKEGKEKEVLDGVGTFTIARRTSYIYTEVVDKLNEALRLKKVEEEEKGLAEASVTEYILFKEVKVK